MSRYQTYNPKSIKNFYSTIKYTHFKGLSDERRIELESILNNWRHFFEAELGTFGDKMTFAAERLTTSSKRFGLNNGDETAYFYFRMVDPEFLFLEAYENANTKEEFQSLCKENFGHVDAVITRLEKEANERFQLVNPYDLIERNAIKKTYIKR